MISYERFCFLTTILTLAFFTSCDLGLNTDDKFTEIEKLPPITTTGENTFGCLVNGKAFVVRNSSKQVSIYQQGQLQFGSSIDDGTLDESIYMILGDPLITNSIYDFKESDSNAEYQYRNIDVVCYYAFEDTYEGSIQFSNIDRDNFIISGIFEFSSITEGCDTIKITDGRFDMQYIP